MKAPYADLGPVVDAEFKKRLKSKPFPHFDNELTGMAIRFLDALGLLTS